MGMLWENFCFIERLKKQSYQKLYSNNYFWRTYDRQEIDLIEDRGGKLHGFDFKWNFFLTASLLKYQDSV